MTKRSGQLAGAAAVALACNDSTGTVDRVQNQNFVAKAAVSVDLDATPRTSFRVEGVNGTIDVIGTTGTESFTIRGERQVWSESLTDAQDFLSRLQVVVTETGNEILIRTVQPQNNGGRRLVVNYVLTVPARLVANVKNVNGVIALDGLTGSITVALINGTITCRAVMGTGGVIDLAAVNGNVTLDIPQGTSAQFAAHLVNGQISSSNLTFQNLVSTPTSLTGTLGGGQGTIDLQTVNGTILARGY